MSEEKKYVDDEIVIIDEKAGSIVLKENGAVQYSDAVKPYLERYSAGDKVNVTLYGNPEQIMFIKKAGEYKAKKPEAPKPAKTDSEKKAQGYVFLNGKWYATLEVLLNKIHELYPGRVRIKTEVIHIDYKEQQAVFKTTVQTIDDEGRVMSEFEGIGDANKTNVNATILTAYIRMAETRSIVRALRWATNIAETSIDELPAEERGNKAKPTPAEPKTPPKDTEEYRGKTTLA